MVLGRTSAPQEEPFWNLYIHPFQGCMEQHTHIIPHVLAWTFADFHVCAHRHTKIHKASHEPSMHVTHTRTFAHTLSEGVRTICGPSHASPMQRCLLAVGVIIGHAGLFLCQRSPCQEMSDNRAQRWLARTAAAHVDPGRDEGVTALCAHTS